MEEGERRIGWSMIDLRCVSVLYLVPVYEVYGVSGGGLDRPISPPPSLQYSFPGLDNVDRCVGKVARDGVCTTV